MLFGCHCLPVDSAQLVVSVRPTSVGSPLLVPSTSRLPSIYTYIIHILYINTRVIIKLIKNDPVDPYKKEDQTLLIFFACFVVLIVKLYKSISFLVYPFLTYPIKYYGFISFNTFNYLYFFFIMYFLVLNICSLCLFLFFLNLILLCICIKRVR